MEFKLQTGPSAERIMNRLLLNIPAELLKIMNERPIEFFIAGGVFVSLITEQKITDIDFFFMDSDDARRMYSAAGLGEGFTDGPVTSNCYNFKFRDKKIQFITKAYGATVQDILSQFDFRAVMIGTNKYGMTNRQFWAEENAFLDIAARSLIIMPGHRHPFNVSGRIAKYIVKKGFTCPPRSFVRLILQQLIRAQSVKTLADVRDEILGLDTLILEKFFKKNAEKWPEGKPVGMLELKDLMVDIDAFFEDSLAAAVTGEKGEDPESEDAQ